MMTAPAAASAATDIANAIAAIVTLIIFFVSVALFLWFYNEITCYFTKKESFGTIVNTKCACSSGSYGKWNDRSSTSGTMCCRTANLRNDYAAGWCIDMHIGDSCMNDWQCSTGFCAPGQTPDSTCQPRKEYGNEVEFNRAWTVCKSGTSSFHNNQKNPNARCCPTKHWQN